MLERSITDEVEAAIKAASADKHLETVRRVTDLFLAQAEGYTGEQIELFGDVLERLIKTIEIRALADVSARIALAEMSTQLASVKQAPPGVIRRLARHDEIEIMELVGAPLTYIRGPFVAEGLLQGGIGALLAIMFLWLSHALTNAWWGTELRTLLDGETLRFLPIRLSAFLILGGMVVGSTGGLAAAWRAGSTPR